MFRDRRDAGRALARAIAELPDLKDAVVLGLPRGGVPVAFEVARACGLPLDILLVRKLGVPGQEELAMGAIASGGTVVLNQRILRATHVPRETLRAVVGREKHEMDRREHAFREGREPIAIEGKTVILVDDGLATGASMRAAARAVRARARQVIIAVPVGAKSTCKALEGEADLVFCLFTPEPLDAVSQFYREFEQTSDEEVRELMREGLRDVGTGDQGIDGVKRG